MRLPLAVCAVAGLLASCGGDSASPAPSGTAARQNPPAANPGAGARTAAGAQDPQAPPTKTRVGFYESAEAKEAPFFEVRTWTNREVKPLPNVDYDLYWQTDEGPNVSHGHTNAAGLDKVGLPSTAKIHRLQIRSAPFIAPVSVPVGQFLQPGRVLRADVLVAPAASIAGVVLDENGAPVPKAQLAAFHQPFMRVDDQERPGPDAKGEADEEGRFILGGFPAGPFVLEAGSGDQVTLWRLTGTLTEGQRVEGAEILLGMAHVVYGQVLGADGQPAAGARIIAGKKGRRTQSRPGPTPELSYIPGRQAVTTSDAKGSFVLPAVPNVQEWNLNVEHSLHKHWLGVLEAGKTDVLVQLEAGLRVEGTLLDPDGQPLARAAVLILGKDLIPATGTTNRDGLFGFGGMEANEALWLVCAQPGFAPLLHGPFALDAQPITGVELRLQAAARIAGKAVSADGKPVSGARIALRRTDLPADLPEKGLSPLVLGRASVLTGDGGDFAFEELAQGDYELIATAPNGAQSKLESVSAGGAPLEIKFP